MVDCLAVSVALTPQPCGPEIVHLPLIPPHCQRPLMSSLNSILPWPVNLNLSRGFWVTDSTNSDLNTTVSFQKLLQMWQKAFFCPHCPFDVHSKYHAKQMLVFSWSSFTGKWITLREPMENQQGGLDNGTQIYTSVWSWYLVNLKVGKEKESWLREKRIQAGLDKEICSCSSAVQH